MRICMINDEHFPFKAADTINVVRTAAALGEAGAHVDLAVPKLSKGNPGLEELCRYYGVPPTFNLIRVPTLAPTSRSLRLEKISHGLLAPWISIIKKSDIVYSRNFIPLALARLLGKPWVLETYRRFAEETPWILGLTKHLPLDKALAAVAHSKQSRDNLERLGFRAEAVLVAYSGYLDEEVLPRIEKKEALSLSNLKMEGPIVLHLGNLDPYVRIDWLLKIAKNLSSVTFLFVGGYEEQHGYWRNECDKMALNNIVFVRNQPPSEVRKYIYTADVLAVVPRNADFQQESKSFLLPSLYKVLPGIPMKIFLYKASGVPIFSPELPYLTEVLHDGENAFLAPLNSTSEATEILRRAIEDKKLAKKIAKASMEDKGLMTWHARGESILRFLDKRMSERV
jgi:glycosyltransferase involved in cell wall biosynthesis